ncbi:MerR family transcriptional regulator [Chitinophaga rhizophila]|uniref:MerR family transcriptional regulator n=1 Tax=Chitinophaga rhizophila TaxID=2866212 RepID=A0ABS7GII2_9BACT|nr:MerR family transcriptional regulator [Chitinophaga rhizophila]MBW8687505.1 MerR family transcriptional regulator [Chitinophaga rhizophila]
MASEKYSIKDLERLSGIKAHTLRIWEKRYGIIQPGRTDTNIRYYGNEELKKILNISLLNQHGYKISTISEMTLEELSEKAADVALFGKKETTDENLLLSLIEMDEILFNNTFSALVLKAGFEDTIIRHIFPFFHRIGIMWQAGTINPAQEHFMSNLIRNKIIMATETLNRPAGKNAVTALLFLPEGELHEIGLLFYNYGLRARGFRTVYLGQSVPKDSLPRVFSICSPDIIITGMTNPIVSQDFLTFASQLCTTSPDLKIYFTGPIPAAIRHQLPNNACTTEDLLTLMRFSHKTA